jgi:hypothetical protein
MKIARTLLIATLGLLLSLVTKPALAQNNGGGGGASAGQIRQEVHSFINDLNDPNYDYSKVPERMREMFQDFRSATQDMDPDQARQFRQDLMQQLWPVLQANQDKIRQAMQDAFLKNLQEPLGCTDEEFAAIRPYLEKVVDAYNAAQVARFGGPGFGNRRNQNGQNGPNGQNGNQPNGNQQNSTPPRPTPPPSNVPVSPVQQAVTDLQTTLDDPNSPSDLIHNKLDVLRQARDKAQQDLSIAQSQLQGLLTQRQEAVLVQYGLLE